MNQQKSWTYEELCTSEQDVLEQIMKEGLTPKLEDLAGYEFKGFNTLDLTSILGFRKFKKGFYWAEGTGPEAKILKGYNVKIVQNAMIDEWIDIMKHGRPACHGFYRVFPPAETRAYNDYPNAVLIDYSAGDNPLLDPSKFLRDYLVQVSPTNRDLFLGKAYVALGPVKIAASYKLQALISVSFFVLQRHNPSTFEVK